ncbi:MAG: bifunctional DNA-formamidopyrimidine glycosylase/DNA-(apurinic or apyrimidinic site) lyase [Acidimicrobiales bacterium]
MPELPEVETVRRQLVPRLSGRTVLEAGSHSSAKFVDARSATGATLQSVERRGKFLIIPTDDGREVVIHLGMTGQIRFRTGEPDDSNPHLRAWWQLDHDEVMEFIDVRRFGRIRIVSAGDYASMPTLHRLGPEPFDPALTPIDFWHRLQQSKRAIKTNLLSQRPIAGVGNIYADEALWLAGINPRATRLGKARAARLLHAIQQVLQQGIDNSGTTLRDYRTVEGGSGDNQSRLHAYGRGGEPCNRCGSILSRAELDARTTTWCPICQRR